MHDLAGHALYSRSCSTTEEESLTRAARSRVSGRADVESIARHKISSYQAQRVELVNNMDLMRLILSR